MLTEQMKDQLVCDSLAGKRSFLKSGTQGDSIIGSLVTVDLTLAEGDTLLGGIVSLDDLTPASRSHFIGQSVFIVTFCRVHAGKTVLVLDGRYPVSIYRVRDYRTAEPLRKYDLCLQPV